MAQEELTPMMRQYRRIKQELPEGVILMFRLGDFYEMFFEDATVAAPILGLALTHRQNFPMCGVPYHAIDSYLAKLIRAGKKAAICEQMEDPALAKGIVRREVTRVVTPGTATEDGVLEAGRNNYLAAICKCKGGWGLAFLDLSTGDLFAENAKDAPGAEDVLRRNAPSETLVGKDAAQTPELRSLANSGACGAITEIEDYVFSLDCARDELLRQFQVHSLDGFGIEDDPLSICPAGAILAYVRDKLRHQLGHIKTLHVRRGGEAMELDEATCLHLDMIPAPGKSGDTTLLGVLNVTCTPMGSRLLRQWLIRPSRKLAEIDNRLDAVELFTKERLLLGDLRSKLSAVRDLERLIAKIGTDRGSPRDVRALSASLIPIPEIAERLRSKTSSPLLQEIAAGLHALPDLVRTIESAIVDEPPQTQKEGGIIRPGWNPDLDEQRSLASDGRAWLAEYQTKEQERTGIKNLKVRHNRVFGFYIEISKSQAHLAPPEYERRQTLVNCERFATPELKEREQKIFGAQDKAQALEYEIFKSIREQAAARTAEIQQTAHNCARLDVLLAYSDRALALGYVRPKLHDGDRLWISEGRHPIVEQLPEADAFVPNDTILDCRENQIMLITGPNMAGKSTYIRQVALIVAMAHAGSFVPAKEAEIPLTDRIFTRVGAGDDLAKGRSTFMVEMQETANILNNATPKSLVVLDEIGRGTSTYDGISIAWAVAEYLHNTATAKAKTLFATHYHELTDLGDNLAGVKNWTVQVRESGDRVVFLRKIAPGCADKSYGIHVAKLAGMPETVVRRANTILQSLENDQVERGFAKLARSARRKQIDPPGQMHLF